MHALDVSYEGEERPPRSRVHACVKPVLRGRKKCVLLPPDYSLIPFTYNAHPRPFTLSSHLASGYPLSTQCGHHI